MVNHPQIYIILLQMGGIKKNGWFTKFTYYIFFFNDLLTLHCVRPPSGTIPLVQARTSSLEVDLSPILGG